MNKYLHLTFIQQIFGWLILLHSGILQSQNPLFKRYFSESAATTGAIYDVFQDKKGFIWLGTENGLARFDGYSIIYFPPNKAFSKSVTNLFQDKQGAVYCQNFSGQFFKTDEDSLKFIPELSTVGNIKQARVIGDSLIAFVKKDGIGFYNFHTRVQYSVALTYHEIQPSTSKQSSNVYSVVLPDKQQLVTIYPNQTKITKTFLSKNVVFFHVKYQNQDLLLGKKFPFEVENVNTHQIYRLKDIAATSIINQFVIIDSQQLAVLTSDGVYLYDNQFNLVRHYFRKESISCFLKDQQANNWFGTLNNGILLVSQPQTESYLSTKPITSIATKGDKILLGTANNELYEYNALTKTSSLIYKDSTIHEVRHIYCNDRQDEWLFSNQQLNVVNGTTIKKFVSSVSQISAYNANTYLLSEGSSVSLFPVEFNQEAFTWFNKTNRVYANKRLALTRQNIRVQASEALDSTKIVCATSNGLWLFTKKNQVELQYKNEKVRALSLCKINNDSLLVSTSQDGILIYTKKKLQEFISPHQLAFNNVYKAKVFNRRVIVVTYKSVEVFDLNKNKLIEQFISDSYHGSDLVDFIVKDSTMYMANVSGMVISPLYNFYTNKQAPLVYFTKTSINGKAVDLNEPVELTYNSYYFDFSFSVIDFRGLESTQAYYRLNNGNWIKANENRILLTALEPNTYKIELKVRNERGKESEKNPQLIFKINPPFYKTWWFLLSCVLLITTLVYLFFRTQINNVKKQNQLLTEKIELENALQKSTLVGIKAQMNPHFIFNALNTIQSYIYLNDKKAAGDYLVSFSELTRYILEMSNKEKIYLSDEIKALELYLKLEKMRFEDDFSYHIHFDGVTSDSIMIPSMLIQPYVENAIKHGLLHKKGQKSVSVEFIEKNQFLTVIVTDNGIGVEASTKINSKRTGSHVSFASDANKKRIELLNAHHNKTFGIDMMDLKNDSGQVIGTKVIIQIPLIL